MKRILITDTHFGVRQNSITWLNSQLRFIYDELIPYIKTLKEQKEKVFLYHLGDVFDSRSSINPFVASKVRKAFIDISKWVDVINIIGGNHDYYSPESDSVDSINMILYKGSGFNPNLITKQFDSYNEDLFIPWYKFQDPFEIQEKIKQLNIKNVFCHADITNLDPIYKSIFKNVNVFSGHIHSPQHKYNLHTLGSTYSLTFADNNSERGFYVLDDSNNLTFIPNHSSIKFWRVWNDNILSYDVSTISKEDYVEIYVNQSELLNEVYIKKLEEFTSKIHNCMIIPQSNRIDESVDEDIVNYNLVDLCKNNIPQELQEKFNIVLEKSNENLTN